MSCRLRRQALHQVALVLSFHISGIYLRQHHSWAWSSQQCFWILYNFINVLHLEEQDSLRRRLVVETFWSTDLLSYKCCWKFLFCQTKWLLSCLLSSTSVLSRRRDKIKSGLYRKKGGGPVNAEKGGLPVRAESNVHVF